MQELNEKLCRVLLVVDDEDDYLVVRDLVAEIATTRFDLEWVDHYEAAREALSQNRNSSHCYDVCLLDHELGEVTGVELIREFAGSGTPFILLTANENHAVDVEASQSGAADYLLKGRINAPILERSIRYAIERKKTEVALTHAQRFAQATVDALPGHIAVLDGSGTIVAVNNSWRNCGAASSFIGAGSDIGTNFLEVCDHKEAEGGGESAACILAVIAGEKDISSAEYFCEGSTSQEPPDKLSARQWFSVKATRFPGDGPLNIVVAYDNITESKLAAHQFEFHSHLLDVVGQAVVVTDTTGKITYWNVAAEKLYGWSSFEVLGRNIVDVTSAETTQQQADAILDGLLRGESWSGEFLVQKRDGTTFPVHVTDTPVLDEAGEVAHIVGISKDISERKKAEETSTLLAAIVESSDDAIISKTLDGVITTWNAGAENLYGYTADEAIGRPVSFLAPPHLSQEMPKLLEKIRQGEQIKHHETVRVRKDGSQVDISLSISPLRNGQGTLIGASSIKRDITERKRVEDSLRESEARSKAVIQHSLDCIITINHEGIVSEFNPAAEATFGYSRAEALGQNLNDLIVPPAFHEGHTRGIAHYLATGEGPLLNRRVEVTARRKDGTEISVELAATEITHSSPPLFTASLRDITERKLAEEFLRESEARFSGAFEYAPIGVALVSPEGQWLKVNRAVCHSLGYSQDQLLARTFQDITHPDDLNLDLNNVRRMLAGEIHSFQMEKRYLHGQGHYVTALLSVSLVRDGQGLPLYFISHIQDISERKQAAAALQKANEELELHVEERTAELIAQVAERERAEREVRAQARLHEAAAELGRRALMDMDLDTLLKGAVSMITATVGVDICSFWERVADTDILRLRTRIGLEEEVGREELRSPPERLIGSDSHLGYSAAINEIVISEDLEHETRFGRSPFLQENGMVSVVAVPVHDGVLYGILSACSSKAHKFGQNEIYFLQTVANVLSSAVVRKHAEAKILQLNSNLQTVNESLRVENIQHCMTMDTLRQVAAALQSSKEEAEQAMQEANAANRAKSEFLSRMSHELRTPLNAILGFGQLLSRQELTPRQQENIGYIVEAGRHLLGLINEVLDIARVEAGRIDLSLEPVAIHEVLNEVIALVQPLAQERRIVLSEKPLPAKDTYVLADLQRLKQVLLNLFSNAIKYNCDGGSVEVSVAVDAQGWIGVAIRDTGPGIAPENISKLFMPFERLGAAASAIEGTGLGLVLSQRLAVAMGGTLEVESRVGEGTTFTLKLRPSQSPVEQVTNSPKKFHLPVFNGDQRTYSVLCIEDNPSNLSLVEAIFENRPEINLICAVQGREGLDLARQHSPDLILLDLDLPDIKGSEVLARLQRSAVTRPLPVIILSADATPAQVERLLAAGAKAYLTKPLDVELFWSTVTRSLSAPKEEVANSCPRTF